MHLLGMYTAFCQTRSKVGFRVACLQAENILHAVEARGFALRPECGSDRAASKNSSVGRDMSKLDPLARPGEDHLVLADNVAGSECRKTDVAFAPRPGLSVARPYAALIERNAAR